MSFAVGVDVPVSQMPAGMAFDGGGGGGGLGQALLGGLQRGVTGALGDVFGGASGATAESGGSRTPYSDRTRDMLGYLLSQAIESFERPESTI